MCLPGRGRGGRVQAPAVTRPTAKPCSAAAIASARSVSSPKRAKRPASAAQPATAPGTVTDRGPVVSTAVVGVAVRGAGPAASSAVQSLPVPHERERVAPDAGRHRLGHAEDGRCGERRVRRVPAALEHP